MPDVIVITGPPGSGKSTLSKALATKLTPSTLVSGDAFFAFLHSGAVDPWLEEAAAQNKTVIEAAAAAVGRLARRFRVVYDGVLGPWYLPSFLDQSGLQSLHYAVLLPPLTVCLDRVTERRNHGFTDLDATQHMWQDFKRSIDDGFERHVIDTLEDPSELVRMLAERMDDRTISYPSTPSPGQPGLLHGPVTLR